jgi:hypothetical protein
MKITVKSEISLSFSPVKIARDYVKQLKKIQKKYTPELSLIEMFEERKEPSVGDFDSYIENVIEKQLPEGYVYEYNDCILLQELVEKEINKLI